MSPVRAAHARGPVCAPPQLAGPGRNRPETSQRIRWGFLMESARILGVLEPIQPRFGKISPLDSLLCPHGSEGPRRVEKKVLRSNLGICPYIGYDRRM